MGVKDLWSILEPARERRPLDALEGKTVAVDLGIWVCEMQAAVKNPTVLKPYLRNLFFRISALLQRRINVVVVADGKPPDLKRQAMLERQKARHKKNGVSITKGDSDAAVGRSKFMGHLKECIEMLRYMGVSVVESDGEAEATCAAMNAAGIVDAVITDDSDAFLYGARTVVRNFNLEGKEPEADFYTMDVVEHRLGLSRTRLVALGVLLGSDYCSAGVPGVGKEKSCKYLQYFNADEDELILPYLKSWTCTRDTALVERLAAVNSANFMKLDKAIRAKAAAAKELVIDAVIDEYTRTIQLKLLQIEWRLPNLMALEVLLSRRLDWVSTYTVAKVVPLMTLWQLLIGGDQLVMAAERIAKTRTRNGQLYYEIQWKKLAYDHWTEDEFYVTLEKKELVEAKLKNLVDEFACRAMKKPKTKRTNRKTKTKPDAAVSSKKETGDVAALGQILEKSLVLIDEEMPSPAKPARRGEHIDSIYSSQKQESREDAIVQKNRVPEQTSSSVEDSPLPLWKRIGLRAGIDVMPNMHA